MPLGLLTNAGRLVHRQAQGWSDTDFMVLGFGRSGTSKGFDYLVDAVPDVARALPAARFVFIGPIGSHFISLCDTHAQLYRQLLGQSEAVPNLMPQ